MNFNDIPNQLRAPLFFSEISVNGSVPTVQSNNDPAPPLISCAGATASFVATTDLGNRTIEVSVNGGSFVDIYAAQELSVLHYPTGQPGASLMIYLAEGITTARVKMRCSSDIGLYVNEVHEGYAVNEIEQSNQSYVLFNEHDNVIDPRLTSNHVYDPNFDDTSTDEDYAVYFRSAHFCLVAA